MITLFTIAGREAPIHVLLNRPRFMLAADLAEIYGTVPKALAQAVKRNPDRFPEDFCFRLTELEAEHLKTQNALSKAGRSSQNAITSAGRWSQNVTTSSGTRTDLRPLVFTHGGANALSGVLTSKVAAQVSVEIHRAFAAMEASALADAKLMLAKLSNATIVKQPIYGHIRLALEKGMSVDQLWHNTSYSKRRVEQAVREMLAMRLIDQPLTGMQDDLFSSEG